MLLDHVLPPDRGPYGFRVDRRSDFTVTICDGTGRGRLTLDVSGVEDQRLSAPQGAEVAAEVAAILLAVLALVRAPRTSSAATGGEVDAEPDLGPPSLPAPTAPL